MAKKLFHVSALALTTLCLLMTGCNKQSSTNSDGSSEEPIVINRPDFTPDYENYEVNASPVGVNVGYYSDIYSRGFSWLTDTETNDTELYLVKSDKGEKADFSGAQLVSGTSVEVTYAQGGKFSSKDQANLPDYTNSSKVSSSTADTTCLAHKVHVENLEKGKAYSYRIGSSAGYKYGAFVVEKEQPKSITAVQVSDAQTKDADKHNIWRNTLVKAVETAGSGLDTIFHNGDQFDQNMGKVHSSDSKSPSRILRYAKALDVVQDYKFNIPYMASSGNHEETAPYIQYVMNDVNYAGYDKKGAYYSYDYSFAHFVVLNTNIVEEANVDTDAQINWLKNDLEAAKNSKWKIVLLHIAPYSTGDHSNNSENQKIVEKLTPIFSEKHVDLVLQAHDHTYNKTLPYRWDAAGYTTTWNNTDVVNFEPEAETKDGVTYDKNPQGTYYVTTGAAGHRQGASESDGIWAEVVNDNGEWKGLNPSKTFLSNKYKIELGKLKYENEYEPYTFSSYTSDQHYEVGDLATGNVNSPMFGVLDLNETTMSYKVYTTNGSEVKLFDSLDVLKS